MISPGDDGFKFVTYKRTKKSSGVTILQSNVNCFKYRNCKYKERKFCKKKEKRILENIEKSDFFEDFKEIFNLNFEKWISTKKNNELNEQMSALLISQPTIDIVCYGLGSFMSCLIAFSQLAFLVALKNFLSVQKVSLYDPVFSDEEKTYLKELGFTVLNTNEKARRPVTNKTIFFMPHCDLPLYNNLLWSNWNINSLVNVMIIGNSLTGYKRLLNSVLERNGHYINMASRFITEIKVKNNFECINVFNDMSIHYFEQDTLSKVTPDIWLKLDRPVYTSKDSVMYS